MRRSLTYSSSPLVRSVWSHDVGVQAGRVYSRRGSFDHFGFLAHCPFIPCMPDDAHDHTFLFDLGLICGARTSSAILLDAGPHVLEHACWFHMFRMLCACFTCRVFCVLHTRLTSHVLRISYDAAFKCHWCACNMLVSMPHLAHLTCWLHISCVRHVKCWSRVEFFMYMLASHQTSFNCYTPHSHVTWWFSHALVSDVLSCELASLKGWLHVGCSCCRSTYVARSFLCFVFAALAVFCMYSSSASTTCVLHRAHLEPLWV